MTSKTEEKQAAANYIINFYNEVQQLTHYYATYQNMISELTAKYGKDQTKLNQAEITNIKDISHTLRYFTNITFIKYSSIMLKTDSKVDKNIDKLQEQIQNKFSPKLDDIKKYVTELNKVLMNTVIKDLLETSTDLYNSLMGGNDKE